MIVQSSDITLSSEHRLTEYSEKSESLRTWSGRERPDFQRINPGNNAELALAVELSEQARELSEKNTERLNAAGESKEDILEDPEMKSARYLMEKTLEVLTGKKVKLAKIEKLDLDKHNKVKGPKGEQSAPADENVGEGWGLEYDYHEVHYEHEEMRFTANGVVRTADGREITFSTELYMSREMYEEYSLSIRMGDAAAIDPLIINFNGNAADLTDAKFSFDLNGDGDVEQIARPAPGSGFLVFDKNGDGVINNGGELFGPGTGDGFGELAVYDSDGNHWIDEGDSIYSELGVWAKGADGTSSFRSLKESGVGAIFLGNIGSPFEIRGSGNSAYGAVRNTGLFLFENGAPGTVQQIDYFV